tara:strand:+ start:396 stop:560 length:165 start_codon:yes stop_codon:yes gene_type:complete
MEVSINNIVINMSLLLKIKIKTFKKASNHNIELTLISKLKFNLEKANTEKQIIR